MKTLKKLTALALAAVLILSLTVSASAKALYSDTADTAALEVLSMANIFDGYTDGAFHGEKVLTRAQLTKIACKMLGLKVDEKAVPTFDDAKGSWAAAYIAAAYDAGVINGKSAEVFAPDDPITRNQAAMIFARMVGFDDSAIASLPWNERVEQAVSTAKLSGFLTLDNAPLTRAEAADAAYVTLFAKSLKPTELSGVLTANTLAGKLGFTTERGTASDDTPTLRFLRHTVSGSTRSAAYPVADRASLPEAKAAPVTVSVTANDDTSTYGWLVGDVGTMLWDNGKTYSSLDLWNGKTTVQLVTSSTVPAQRPLLVSYERRYDNAVSNVRYNYPGDGTLQSAAIRRIEDEYLLLTTGAYLFTEDTAILYIDSSTEEVGCDGVLAEADKADDGTYVDNVLYLLDDDGKLACVVYDVSNVAPTLIP